MPAVVGTHGAQVQHGLGIVDCPPCAGKFEPFLDDIAMSALDFPGADGKISGDGRPVVELAGAIGNVALAGPNRRLLVWNGIRFNQKDRRIEAHIFVAFLAYCLQVSIKAKLKALAPGLTPRTVLEKLAGLQMVDVHLPTTDGRQLPLRRYTEPDADQRLLLAQLKLQLPKQPPPKITTPLPAKQLSPTAV